MGMKSLADFEEKIPAVLEILVADGDQNLATFFTSLTPGYQREWARYIFGVKAVETQARHIEQMKIILAAGFKSKRAYDQRA
ncbi:hypothetical protein WOSG25_012820 [Weissella oryzae SG25]|uniref:Uncharacterized protein n=1 Tax=Weissella oryzae (strain DSM 25784 / JCM 18191 / LMG 30913 / SG25) TaxID=1329250 RepID=A0A069CR25_WEIOS|nr:YdeI/OmpD-associated family protein [Weissella oryzae]GAK30185.1 hypothetical protein WOSG25_012820 [Weissella oryzae SG25]